MLDELKELESLELIKLKVKVWNLRTPWKLHSCCGIYRLFFYKSLPNLSSSLPINTLNTSLTINTDNNDNFYLLTNILCVVWYSSICLDVLLWSYSSIVRLCPSDGAPLFIVNHWINSTTLFDLSGVGSLRGIYSRLLWQFFLLSSRLLSTSHPFPRNGLVSYPLVHQFCDFRVFECTDT